MCDDLPPLFGRLGTFVAYKSKKLLFNDHKFIPYTSSVKVNELNAKFRVANTSKVIVSLFF